MTPAEMVRRLRAVRHYECEDCWYSCPESDEGCCNDNLEGCYCNAPLMWAAADMIASLAREAS